MSDPAHKTDGLQPRRDAGFAPSHGSAAWVRRQMELADLKLQSRARRLGAHWYGVKDCETYEKRMNDLQRAAIEYAEAVKSGVLMPPNKKVSDAPDSAATNRRQSNE